MNEIKVSCPNCNQHIRLDSGWAGKEIACPSCGNRFTVAAPVPPIIGAGTPPPLPLTPANPSRPTSLPVTGRKSSALVWLAVAGGALLVLLLIGVAAAGLIAVRKMKAQEQRQRQMIPSDPGSRRSSSPELRSANLTNVRISGSLCGAPVQLTTGDMTSHAITISEGTGAERRAILLFLFLNGASPEGRVWTLPGSGNQQQPRPHVHFRCPSSKGGSGVLPPTYEMHLAFEQERNGRIPAVLELSEPVKGIHLKGSFELVKGNSF